MDQERLDRANMGHVKFLRRLFEWAPELLPHARILLVPALSVPQSQMGPARLIPQIKLEQASGRCLSRKMHYRDFQQLCELDRQPKKKTDSMYELAAWLLVLYSEELIKFPGLTDRCKEIRDLIFPVVRDYRRSRERLFNCKLIPLDDELVRMPVNVEEEGRSAIGWFTSSRDNFTGSDTSSMARMTSGKSLPEVVRSSEGLSGLSVSRGDWTHGSEATSGAIGWDPAAEARPSTQYIYYATAARGERWAGRYHGKYWVPDDDW